MKTKSLTLIDRGGRNTQQGPYSLESENPEVSGQIWWPFPWETMDKKSKPLEPGDVLYRWEDTHRDNTSMVERYWYTGCDPTEMKQCKKSVSVTANVCFDQWLYAHHHQRMGWPGTNFSFAELTKKPIVRLYQS